MAMTNTTNIDDYGCRLNMIPPVELFCRYEQGRFLYPAKRQRLAPVLPLVIQNWIQARRAAAELLWEVSYDDPITGGWASASAWRSTLHSWQGQHVVSTGGPVASRAVILASLGVALRDEDSHSMQNWFQPSNRFAAKVFGGALDSLSPEVAALHPLEYLLLPRGGLPSPVRTVVPLDGGRCPELISLAAAARGDVYVRAEELDQDDFLLNELDRLYQSVGLRRYRRICLALDSSGSAIGAAIAYRGPLGFNLSFLENRCELLVAPTVPGDAVAGVVQELLIGASTAYADYELSEIPVIANAMTAPGARLAGAEPVRSYTQTLWLRSAYPSWQRHVADVYQRELPNHSWPPAQGNRR